MTSKEYMVVLERYLKIESNTIIKETEYGNGYFLFDMGDDSVVQFKVKGLKGWLFRIWFEFKENSNQIKSLTCFTRHKDDTDKFKPSRSVLKCDVDNFNNYENTKEDWWICYHIEELINYVKSHPLMAYEQSYWENLYINGNIFKNYFKTKLSFIKNNIKEWYCEKYKYNINYLQSKIDTFRFKLDFKKHNMNNITVELRDNNSNGWVCYPRYEIRVITNDKENFLIDTSVLVKTHYDILGKYKKNRNIHFLDNDNNSFNFTLTDKEIKKFRPLSKFLMKTED